MDLQMPKMDGVDVMIAIRREFPEARIIVLTTFAREVEIQRALEAGACAYILKSLGGRRRRHCRGGAPTRTWPARAQAVCTHASGLLPAGDEVWYGYRRATETRFFGARTNASKTGKIKWADTMIF